MAAEAAQARSNGCVYALCEDGTLYARHEAARPDRPEVGPRDCAWVPQVNIGTAHRVIAVDEGYLYGIRGRQGTVDAQTVRHASDVGWRTVGANTSVVSISGHAGQLYAVGDKSGGDSVYKLEQPRSCSFPAWVAASKGRSYFMAIHAGTLYALGNAIREGERWVYKQQVVGMSPLSSWEKAFRWTDGLGPFAVVSQGGLLVALAATDHGHVARLEIGGADAEWGLEPKTGMLASQRVIAIAACAGGAAAVRLAGPTPAPAPAPAQAPAEAALGQLRRGDRTPSPPRERPDGAAPSADAEDLAARLAAALGDAPPPPPAAPPGRELAPWCPGPPQLEPARRDAPPPPEHFPGNPWGTPDAWTTSTSSASATRRGGYRRDPERELRHACSDDALVEDVRRLLAEGAPIHATDRGGKTPLHYAARSGAVACVQALLDHKADPNVGDTSSNLRPVDEAEYWAVKRPKHDDGGLLRAGCLRVLEVLRACGGERCPIAERFEPWCAQNQRAKLEEEARLRGIVPPWADDPLDVPPQAQAAWAPAGAAAAAACRAPTSAEVAAV
ncbi:unnamed protein product, partial [Prorocentrum cordatum]